MDHLKNERYLKCATIKNVKKERKNNKEARAGNRNDNLEKRNACRQFLR